MTADMAADMAADLAAGMAPLAQAFAGLALAAGLAMLCTRQTTFICFAAQSAFVAAVAILGGQPLLMLAPAAGVAALWMARSRTPLPSTAIGQSAGIVAGAILTLLCLSQGETGIPLAVVLLAVVLAAARRDPVTQFLALGALGNGIALTGCLVATDDLLPLACLALPLPIAASLIGRPADLLATARRWAPRDAAARLGWAELAGAAALFATTLIVPLGALASVFAPLIAFDGVVRARVAQSGSAVGLSRRVASLLQLGFVLLAVCATEPLLSWIAVAGAASAALLRSAAEPPGRAVPAFIGVGLALFGLLTLPVEPALTGYLGLFAGYAMLAASVPDLAVPLLVLLLRSALQTEWLPAADALGMSVALIALLTCSALLIRPGRNRADVLLLAQASIAGLAIATSQPDARFAAAVLLVLLSLTRTASRATTEPAALLSLAALSGLPPIGVFPGLVLVVLAVSSHAPWLLLPLGLALIPVLLAGLPRRMPAVPLRTGMRSIAWLPLALAALFGLFAPMEFVRWLAAVTMGPS
jgi:hypothetical protein